MKSNLGHRAEQPGRGGGSSALSPTVTPPRRPSPYAAVMADIRKARPRREDIDPNYRRRGSAIDRFWRFITPEPNSGCWLWIGALDTGGYGQMYLGGGKTKTAAYRFAFETYKGPVPPGLELDHKCRVRSCCNPDHLRAITKSENLAGRNFARGRRTRLGARTHCGKGHEYSVENTGTAKDGSRVCKACRKKYDREFGQRKRATKQV